MRNFRFAAAVASCLFLSKLAVADDATGKLFTIPSWGDYAVVYGPGTDPAMDSPAAMENMFKFWKARGYAGVHLRTDLQQYAPMVRRNPRVQMNPGLALLWQHIDKLAEHYDYFQAAQQAANKTGFEFWASHPHIYSDGAPEDVGEAAPGRMVPWSYVSKVLYEHPEMVSIDRKGNKYWMVPEYAYPLVRSAKVSEFVYMAKKYGIKGFVASLRSEVSQLIDPADKADRYGFNQPVVDDMKRLYNVDIMTDPRFDVDSPDFDLNDPMVNKWRDLRGSYLTQFFRELRQGLDAVDPKIKIAVTLAGEYAGPPLGNWRTDWRTWVDEGLVDMIVSPVFFEATLDHEAVNKGYLTHSRIGKGTVPHSVMRDYIKQSKHPDIEVCATGGPPYFLKQPPSGSDALLCDVWYSSYHLAWYQRWQQWMRDVKEFGSIKFLAQNFDTVSPADYAGISGGWGTVSYDPKIRACAGGWWRLGTGTNARPFPQKTIKRGKQGQAIRLTSATDGSGTLIGWHMASPDRGTPTAAVDTSVTNGVCTFEFWLFRQTAESAITAYLQKDSGDFDVGLRVAPVTGRISYSTGNDKGGGQWVETSDNLPARQWTKLSIRVDMDQRRYSGFVGDAEKTALWQGVPYVIPKERFVEQHGVNIPIPVPVWKSFRQVMFVPGGKTGTSTFVDDVAVLWRPTPHFVEPGSTVDFVDDFEARPADGPLVTASWKQADSASQQAYTVINDTSFGLGVKSLRTSGGTKLLANPRRPLKIAGRHTLDFDVFLRSNEPYPYIIPNPAIKSTHQTRFGLTASDGTMLAGVFTGNGTWQYWNGDVWTDSGIKVAYDAWNRVQIALDGNGSYQVVVQPVGEVPTRVGKGRLGKAEHLNTMTIFIDPPKTPDHISCYDNIKLTSGRPVSTQRTAPQKIAGL